MDHDKYIRQTHSNKEEAKTVTFEIEEIRGKNRQKSTFWHKSPVLNPGKLTALLTFRLVNQTF